MLSVHSSLAPLSLTRILALAFGDQYAGVPEAVLAHGADRGTAVHAACHYLDDGDLDEASLDPEVRPYVVAWGRFLADTHAQVLAAELPVESKRYGYTGHPDRVMLYQGRRAILDIKATAALSPLVALQTAGYAIAYEEMTGERIATRLAVRLLPDETYRMETYTDRMDRYVFLAAVQIASWRMKHLKGAEACQQKS